MFGPLGGPEIFLILVVALIIFGPKKLPEIGKSMGRMLSEFRKASNDFKRTLDEEVEAEKAKPAPPPALDTPVAEQPSVLAPPAATGTRETPPPPIEPK
jgi:TatA/E family protein of Tat protein translocase